MWVLYSLRMKRPGEPESMCDCLAETVCPGSEPFRSSLRDRYPCQLLKASCPSSRVDCFLLMVSLSRCSRGTYVGAAGPGATVDLARNELSSRSTFSPRWLRQHFGHADLGVYAEVLEGGRIASGDALEPLQADLLH